MCGGHRKLSSLPNDPAAGCGAEAMETSSEAAAVLLELAASDDLSAFRRAVEDDGQPLDAAASWYGRSPGRGMGYQLRTPLMIAALYGSTAVMGYILSARPAEAVRHADSDGATALHCAAAGGSAASLEAVKLLIGASADVVDALNAGGSRPGDVIARQFSAAGCAPSWGSWGSTPRTRSIRTASSGPSSTRKSVPFSIGSAPAFGLPMSSPPPNSHSMNTFCMKESCWRGRIWILLLIAFQPFQVRKIIRKQCLELKKGS